MLDHPDPQPMSATRAGCAEPGDEAGDLGEPLLGELVEEHGPVDPLDEGPELPWPRDRTGIMSAKLNMGPLTFTCRPDSIGAIFQGRRHRRRSPTVTATVHLACCCQLEVSISNDTR